MTYRIADSLRSRSTAAKTFTAEASGRWRPLLIDRHVMILTRERRDAHAAPCRDALTDGPPRRGHAATTGTHAPFWRRLPPSNRDEVDERTFVVT
jgi:hypothetical protein